MLFRLPFQLKSGTVFRLARMFEITKTTITMIITYFGAYKTKRNKLLRS